MISRRRAAEGELASTFVGLLEPYEGAPRIQSAVREDREGDAAVRLEIRLADGARDRISIAPEGLRWERRDAQGRAVFSGAAGGR